MPSHRLNSVKYDNIEILGYSVAGEETVIGIPVLDVCFDIGKAPEQMIPINNVLLTHGHIDHCSGIAYHLSHRLFSGQSAGTVYAPQNCIEPLKQILDGWGRLDGNRIQCNLVAAEPGNDYQIKPNLFARVFPTKHCYGSVGYSIIEKRQKLKEEFKGLSGPEIVKLKKQSIQIQYTIELPIVSYFGDTEFVDYSTLDYVANSKILIVECTFVDQDHNGKAEAGKHMHINQLGGLLEKMNNELVIITHLSQRTHMKTAKEIMAKKLPADILSKTVLLMDKKRDF